MNGFAVLLLVPFFLRLDGAVLKIGESEEEIPQEIPDYPKITTEPPPKTTTDFDWEPELKTMPTPIRGMIGSKTIIAIEFPSDDQEEVFLRGGFSDGNPVRCRGKAEDNPCSIPIRHIFPKQASTNYFDWATGDMYLDWVGREEEQFDSNGTLALGTPMRKLTSRAALIRCNSDRYRNEDVLKKFYYWLVELDMDCSETYGYFEVKVVVRRKNKSVWIEKRIKGKVPLPRGDSEACVGGIGSEMPFYSDTHIGKCGFTNIFGHRNSYCEVNRIYDPK